jgi:hypothetical protein
MDAPRALPNEMAWFMGRHNQGFQFADLTEAIWLGNAVGVVLVGMGMRPSHLNRLGGKSLDGSRNGYVVDVTLNRLGLARPARLHLKRCRLASSSGAYRGQPAGAAEDGERERHGHRRPHECHRCANRAQ